MRSLDSQKPSPLIKPVAITIENIEYVDASCATLTMLAQYIPEWGANKTAREVAATLCGYFDVEFCHHREEQESGLFPALCKRAQADQLPAVQGLVNQLTSEHLSIEGAWKRLRAMLNDIASCRSARLSVEEVARFATLYRDHVAKEEAQLISLAARILGLGEDMKIGVAP